MPLFIPQMTGEKLKCPTKDPSFVSQNVQRVTKSFREACHWYRFPGVVCRTLAQRRNGAAGPSWIGILWRVAPVTTVRRYKTIVRVMGMDFTSNCVLKRVGFSGNECYILRNIGLSTSTCTNYLLYVHMYKI